MRLRFRTQAEAFTVCIRQRRAQWSIATRSSATIELRPTKREALDRALAIARAHAAATHAGVVVLVLREDGSTEDVVFVGYHRVGAA